MTKTIKNNKSIKLWGLGVLATLAIIAVSFSVGALYQEAEHDRRMMQVDSQEIPAESLARIDQAVETSVVADKSLNEQLLYLIEEEKLAHDVYQYMYDLYGSRVFANIKNSETKHQEQVLLVMNNFGIDDPRSSEVGVFNDAELQALYNQLIDQGSQSLTEAYKVGVAIEELDIADITAQINSTDKSEVEVISMLESLRSGSENHLRAFSRQL
jgi:hypothetical protein